MRYYSPAVRSRVAGRATTLGRALAKQAVKKEMSVLQLCYLLGTSRGTIYGWYAGGTVSNAYKDRVQELINILTTASSPEASWSTACTHFRRPVYPMKS